MPASKTLQAKPSPRHPDSGDTFRRASAIHKRLINGAKITIEMGLKFCVCGADRLNQPNTLSSVLRSANRVSDEPACSNKVQNTTLKMTSTMAATIIWNSALLPLNQ